MPFKKIDINKIVNEKIESDRQFAKAYEEIKKEYDLIDQVPKDKKAMYEESALKRN